MPRIGYKKDKVLFFFFLNSISDLSKYLLEFILLVLGPCSKANNKKEVQVQVKALSILYC